LWHSVTSADHGKDVALDALFTAATFALTFSYVKVLASGELAANFLMYTDYTIHVQWAMDIGNGHLPGHFVQNIPYPIWHIGMFILTQFGFATDEAAAFVSAGLAVASYRVVKYALLLINAQDRPKTLIAEQNPFESALACVISMAINFAGPFFIRSFFAYQYRGQFSPNPFHSPTQMAARPFGLICFILAGKLVGAAVNSQKICLFDYMAFSLSLLISVLTKPTYAFVILPSIAILWLVKSMSLPSIGATFGKKKLLEFAPRLAGSCLPALIVLVLQYYGMFIVLGKAENGDAGIFLTAPGAVWSTMSNHIWLSVIVAMAFPVAMVFVERAYFLKSTMGMLGILTYLFGVLEFLFLAESGTRFKDGNFAWPMMSGMAILFTVAGARLLARTQEKKPTLALWILLFGHMASGFQMLRPGL